MRAKIRVILQECIESGIVLGYARAHKHTDEPSRYDIQQKIEDAIWLEIDERFDFERNVCDEVVEGFDHLAKEREWVDLTDDDIQAILKEWAQAQMTVREMLRETEAKLKEKNQ